MGIHDRDWMRPDGELTESEKRKRKENARQVFEKAKPTEAPRNAEEKENNRIDRIRFKRSEKEKEEHLKRVRKQLEKSMWGTKWRFLKVTMPPKEPVEEGEELTVVEVVGIIAIGLSIGWLLIALLTRYL